MAEVMYATPNMMTKARNTQGEREERIVDIYASPESLRDQQQGSVGTEESSKSLGTGRSQRPDAVSPPCCPIRAVMVLLGLLSVVLLAGLIGLAVQHKKTASMERDMEQLLLTLKNLTEQRDSLLCKQECPDGWRKFGCKCYKATDTYHSWNNSREFCVSQGADLVVVDSKEEMDFIGCWYNVYFWLGATDAAGEGTWRWVDGTVLPLDDPSWSGVGPHGGPAQLQGSEAGRQEYGRPLPSWSQSIWNSTLWQEAAVHQDQNLPPLEQFLPLFSWLP
ncbi:CD209 antigen-like protein E [Gadus morhua]|uniref:CD209 antigen-like protein E n=1 Tax=Gadus morhua TaxID=8049 RepID=UPI0011B4A44A|nr:CD209 antigen-like protein E [Gadus morhua]